MTAGLSPQRSLELVVVNANPLASVRAEVVLDGLTGSGQGRAAAHLVDLCQRLSEYGGMT